MLRVRAKFKCQSIAEDVNNKTAVFTAVYGKEGENADFTKYTPNGTLTMAMDKDAPAANAFTPGKDYYLTFEPAEA